MEVAVVAEEHYWYPEDGGQVWLAGYAPFHSGAGAYLARAAPELAALGQRESGVAGAARHHARALAAAAAHPGRALVLLRDAANPHDPNAIAVDLASGEQLGWVPREHAA